MADLRGIDGVRVRASGKINLALRVGPRRADGYHPLATVFQSVSVYDDLEVRPAPPGEFPVTVTGAQADLVPTDGRNPVSYTHLDVYKRQARGHPPHVCRPGRRRSPQLTYPRRIGGCSTAAGSAR